MSDEESGNIESPKPARKKRARWTKGQEILLQRLWGTKSDAEVAADIGKTVQSVRYKATEMKIRETKGKRAVCRSGRVTTPWSEQEDLVLVKNVGHLNIFELNELLPKRNRLGIERRCYELGFSPTQGTYTRLQIERETGYDWRQIQRARDALKQDWKRYGIRKYMISFDQAQDIIEYLKTESRKWSLHYDIDCCRLCGTTGRDEKSRHSGDGLCKKCVTGDSLIMVKNLGLVEIATMVGKGDFEVWSGSNWQTTEAVYAGNKHTVTVALSNGWSLRATPDHEFVTADGRIRADQLLGRLMDLPMAESIVIDLDRKFKCKTPDSAVQVTVVLVACGDAEDVYDLLNVGDEQSFLCNGVTVSNCWDSRRHARVRLIKSMIAGEVIVLTEEIWEALPRTEDAV